MSNSRDDFTAAAQNGQQAEDAPLDRRKVLTILAGLGVGTAVFQRALAAQVEAAGQITPLMVQQAEWVAGIELSEEERETTAGSIDRAQKKFDALREVKVGYDVSPAIAYYVAPPQLSDPQSPSRSVKTIESSAPKRPADENDLAFMPISELSALIRDRKVTSVELTKLYLKRLRQYDPALLCVVSLTEETALRQAERADREIAAGRYRGPLHGIPWGAKDLIAYPGYKTTWGAGPFQEQTLDVKATVARRLEEAGAVLVAKLSLGALAWGDKWFGGMTRNPWNQEQGSSGSSAGSSSATAAGLVGFAIGSETLGSIVSPSRRCGNSSLRPTFGRVSRHGCMALAWSMDKLGPICRSVEDSALVFAAIHGYDGLDTTAVTRPFTWPAKRDVATMKVGYFEEGSTPPDQRPEILTLDTLGVKLVPIKLPKKLPAWALTTILNVEAATVFDPLTRNGITDGIGRWPGVFNQGQFTPAVEYLRAQRVRSMLMREMEEVFADIDAYVNGDDLTITNMTGHPTAVIPGGFHERDGVATPFSITFTGRLFSESDLLSLAHAYQQATDHHLRRPPMEKLKPLNREKKEDS